MVSTQKVQCKVANQITKQGGIDQVVTTVSFWMINLFLNFCFQEITNTEDADWAASVVGIAVNPETGLNVGEKAKMTLTFDANSEENFNKLFE